MSTKEEFRAALVAVIRENVMQKKTIRISGLGTFKSVHAKQYQKQFDNGRVVLEPPRDFIQFTPLSE